MSPLRSSSWKCSQVAHFPTRLELASSMRGASGWVRNTPTATRQWHDLKVRISGAKVEGYLDGKLYLEHTLAQPVSGRIGLWSKADSHMYFADYTVTTTD